ncbi:Uncharacterised protein [Burkholderia pseudomallei]|nr:Uncharacterised protein [Burkholderia pseudomallei]CFL29783.1 Uncharacterised protein [Burkholderia pseudomallei]CRY19211.1 Uncharacterised protein [Burkholderia pseudomallei]
MILRLRIRRVVAARCVRIARADRYRGRRLDERRQLIVLEGRVMSRAALLEVRVREIGQQLQPLHDLVRRADAEHLLSTCRVEIVAVHRVREARIVLVTLRRYARIVDPQIADAEADRARRVVRADAERRVVRKAARLAAERVEAAEREARDRRAAVLDRVRDREAVVGIVHVVRVREVVAADVAVQRERLDVIDDRIPLAAERERAELRVADADVRVARERKTAAEAAGIDVEAAFEPEDRAQAPAEILGTAHAPAAAGRHARRELHEMLTLHVRHIVDAVLEDAV